MSYDSQNPWTARRGGAATQGAFDLGQRQYMLRVYNYMASGLAVTGVVAWLAYDTGITAQMTGGVTSVITSGNTGNFTACGVGNIDNDGTKDEWSISSESRLSGTTSTQFTTCGGGVSVGGDPCNDVNDV